MSIASAVGKGGGLIDALPLASRSICSVSSPLSPFSMGDIGITTSSGGEISSSPSLSSRSPESERDDATGGDAVVHGLDSVDCDCGNAVGNGGKSCTDVVSSPDTGGDSKVGIGAEGGSAAVVSEPDGVGIDCANGGDS